VTATQRAHGRLKHAAVAMRTLRLLTYWHGQMASVAPHSNVAGLGNERWKGEDEEEADYRIDATLRTSVSGVIQLLQSKTGNMLLWCCLVYQSVHPGSIR
jgi:hypothetical protein